MWEDLEDILGFTPKNSRKANYGVRLFNNDHPLQFLNKYHFEFPWRLCSDLQLWPQKYVREAVRWVM